MRACLILWDGGSSSLKKIGMPEINMWRGGLQEKSNQNVHDEEILVSVSRSTISILFLRVICCTVTIKCSAAEAACCVEIWTDWITREDI